jgi:hypothetical protein
MTPQQRLAVDRVIDHDDVLSEEFERLVSEAEDLLEPLAPRTRRPYDLGERSTKARKIFADFLRERRIRTHRPLGFAVKDRTTLSRALFLKGATAAEVSQLLDCSRPAANKWKSLYHGWCRDNRVLPRMTRYRPAART